MAGKKELILITKRFPFFKTEAFLESEINMLAAHFDRVRIFPYEIGEDRREVPANVEINTAFAKQYGRKFSRAAGTLFSRQFYQAISDHRHQLKNAKDLNMLLKFTSNARAYYHYFEQHLPLLQRSAMVYTYWFNEATYALLKLKEAHYLGTEIISRAHRFDIYEGLSTTRNFWPYRRFCVENTDALYSISADGKEYLERKYGKSDSIHIARLGVYDRQKTAKRSGKGTVRFVSVSRVAPMKRVDFIRKAIIQYAFDHPSSKIQWTHFGDGPGWEALRKQEDLPENLQLDLRGNVKNEEIYAHYEQHPVDLFTNLSSSEGIPVSIMEAISFGIPVVATKVGGTAEIVSEINGKLLAADPTLEEVVAAFGEVVERNIPAGQIRHFFSENYNAATNYRDFAATLAKQPQKRSSVEVKLSPLVP